MNFYKHHLGDYDGATAHLDWAEDLAYRRLLGVYYRTELPIPVDLAAACRLVRVSSQAQRRATETVLAEFFVKKDDGWHNQRADEEIAAYKAQSSTNRRIAQSRAGKRIVNESSHESSTNRYTNRTPNHEPLTKNQEPESTKSNAMSGLPDVAPLSKQKNGSQNLGVEASEILAFLNEKAGRRYQANRVNLGFIIGRLKDGATVTECRQVIVKKCREWGSDEKMGSYLRPATLFNPTKFSQYQGELVAPAPNVSRETSAP